MRHLHHHHEHDEDSTLRRRLAHTIVAQHLRWGGKAKGESRASGVPLPLLVRWRLRPPQPPLCPLPGPLQGQWALAGWGRPRAHSAGRSGCRCMGRRCMVCPLMVTSLISHLTQPGAGQSTVLLIAVPCHAQQGAARQRAHAAGEWARRAGAIPLQQHLSSPHRHKRVWRGGHH